jgi:hypothetical protein
MRSIPFIVLAIGVGLTAPASAQRFEVGGGAVAALPSLVAPALDARVNINERLAVDVSTVFDPSASRGVQGAYLLQVHQRFGDRAQKVRPFAAYGVTGAFKYRRNPELRFTLSSGDTVTYPAYTDAALTRPAALAIGGGASIRLASHAFLELGGQTFIRNGIGFGFTSGVTVPLGKGR